MGHAPQQLFYRGNAPNNWPTSDHIPPGKCDILQGEKLHRHTPEYVISRQKIRLDFTSDISEVWQWYRTVAPETIRCPGKKRCTL